MPDIRIGDGHTTPPADYLTAQLAYDTLSGADQGGDVVMLGKGFCGSAFSPTGTPVNKWSLRTEGVDYKGNNAAELCGLDRVSLAAPIDISHVTIISTNPYVTALTIAASSDGSDINNCLVWHPNAAGVDAVSVNGSVPNSKLSYSVLVGGVNGVDYGFSYKLPIESVTQLYATQDGFEASGTNSTILNTLAIGNGTTDYSNVTTEFCASSDTSGDVINIAITELVDYAGGDYRVKKGSPLATAGKDGTFIGAYLEESSGTAITGTVDISLGGASSNIVAQLGSDVYGTVTSTLDSSTSSIIAQLGIDVSGNVNTTLNDSSLLGDMSVGNIITGSAAANLSNVLSSISATLGDSISGRSDVNLTDAIADVVATIGQAITGVGTAQIEQAVLKAVGATGAGLDGVVAINLAAAKLNGIASVGIAEEGVNDIGLTILFNLLNISTDTNFSLSNINLDTNFN